MNEEIRRLYRSRPKNHLVRYSAALLASLIVYAWGSGRFGVSELVSERRLANLERFLGELLPFPLQGAPFDGATALAWAADIISDKGLAAVVTTLAISVAAIVLAALLAMPLTLPAARTLTTSAPFVADTSRRAWWHGLLVRGPWLAVVTATRLLLIFLRAIPEYVWAFLMLALLGPSAWPAVLALALHNAGILGKLSAEVVEDLPPGPLKALRAAGASRLQTATLAVFPLTFNRLLLFFFYRWETCVREATVLGMLGIVSLGFWIQDARARNFYDEMFFLMLLGAGLVMIGDIVSSLARSLVRRAA